MKKSKLSEFASLEEIADFVEQTVANEELFLMLSDLLVDIDFAVDAPKLKKSKNYSAIRDNLVEARSLLIKSIKMVKE